MNGPTMLNELTGPDGPFPLKERSVHGIPMQVYDRDPRTLRDVFLSSDLFQDRTAAIYESQRWTFAQQRVLVVNLAWSLKDRFGIEQGDRVAIAMRNYPEWAFAFWAIQLLGAVVVPLNAWATGPELAELLDHCAPKLVFADQERLDRIGEIAGEPLALISVRSREHATAVPIEELMGAVTHREPPDCHVSPDDIATIIYTSGTTGRPKGVVASHFAHTASLLNRYIRVVAAACSARGEIFEPSRGDLPCQTKLVVYPLFHIAGIGTLCAATFNGHALVTMYKWDVAKAVAIVANEQISELTGPPLIAQQIVEAGRRLPQQLGSLRLLGAGGASLPATLLADIAEVFQGRVSPTTGYGLTETTGGVIAISGADFIAHPDSIGRPLPTVEIKILGDDGAPLPAGQSGELAIRAPQLMNGYYRDEAITREAITDGWFHTGDLASRGDDGLIRLVGRLKDIVIRGGENINCGQVESCIVDHPAVAEVAAVGTPHPGLGEELVAVVRLHDGHTIEAQELRSFVASRLAAFKVPAHVLFVERPLPRTASGKLLKREIMLPPDMLRPLTETTKG